MSISGEALQDYTPLAPLESQKHNPHRVCHSVGDSETQTHRVCHSVGVSGDQLGYSLLSAHSCVGSFQEDKLGGLTLAGLLLCGFLTGRQTGWLTVAGSLMWAHSCVGSFQEDKPPCLSLRRSSLQPTKKYLL